MTATRLYTLAIDANVILSAITNAPGRDALENPSLRLLIATYAFDEIAEHLARILHRKAASASAAISSADANAQHIRYMAFIERNTRQISVHDYAQHEAEARDRVPGDPDDWHTVALALAFATEIWTNDRHFLGCGVPTWTSEALRRRLAAGRMP